MEEASGLGIEHTRGGIGGHPKGLTVLFFTEFWERFSYYGMRALLVLFMVAPASEGGYGMDIAKAAMIYGWYTMFAYLTCIPGGWIADRFLGQRNSILLGGVIIALGHISLIFHSMSMFYLGLGLIVTGTGLLKPNISSIVGGLYAPGDPRRDSGFSIFYMGINLGALLSPLICGWVGQNYSWHAGFSIAAFGMVAGVIQFARGIKHFGEVGAKPKKLDKSAGEKHEPFSKEDWQRITALCVLFIFATLFWAAFEQAGSSLNLFADKLTDNNIFGWDMPSTWHQSTNPLFIILLTPFFAWLWAKKLPKMSSPVKFSWGLLLVGLGFLVMSFAAMKSGPSKALVSPMWLTMCFLLHTMGELCLSPIGLSTVTKLAPKRIVSSMMGLWFLSISLGSKLGGWVAGFFESYPLPKLFGSVFVTTACAGILLLLIAKPIKKLAGKHG